MSTLARPAIITLLLAATGCRCGDESVRPVPAELRLSISRLEFPPTPVGTTRAASFSIFNPSRGDLDVSLTLPSSSPFHVSPNLHLEAGAQASVLVKFEPTVAGPHAASLVLTAGDASGLLELSGLGVACEIPRDCRAFVWDEDSGSCVESTKPDGAFCESVCAITGSCQIGTCQPIAGLDCDDGNACTRDSCDESRGCVHEDVTASCPAPAEACEVAVCGPDTGCGRTLAADGSVCGPPAGLVDAHNGRVEWDASTDEMDHRAES